MTQSIDLLFKPMDWFVCDSDLRYERGNDCIIGALNPGISSDMKTVLLP